MPRSVYRTWNSRATSAVTRAVLGQIDLEDKVVTADALHTVKATAEFIHQAGGEFALPVKENRKALFDALDALPWHQVPIAHTATDRGRGPDHHPHRPGAARRPTTCRSRTSARHT